MATESNSRFSDPPGIVVYNPDGTLKHPMSEAEQKLNDLRRKAFARGATSDDRKKFFDALKSTPQS